MKKGMLVLSRNRDEEIIIRIPSPEELSEMGFSGGDITIAYLGQRGNEAKIGINANQVFNISRKELINAVRDSQATVEHCEER